LGLDRSGVCRLDAKEKDLDAMHLAHSTGDGRIDECLRAFITIIEAVFPQRIRTYYVLGSYADRNAVPGSDIDLFVVSKDRFRREDQDLYRRTVIASCRSRVRHRTLLLLEDNGAQRRTHERRLDCTDLRGH